MPTQRRVLKKMVPVTQTVHVHVGRGGGKRRAAAANLRTTMPNYVATPSAGLQAQNMALVSGDLRKDLSDTLTNLARTQSVTQEYLRQLVARPQINVSDYANAFANALGQRQELNRPVPVPMVAPLAPMKMMMSEGTQVEIVPKVEMEEEIKHNVSEFAQQALKSREEQMAEYERARMENAYGRVARLGRHAGLREKEVKQQKENLEKEYARGSEETSEGMKKQLEHMKEIEARQKNKELESEYYRGAYAKGEEVKMQLEQQRALDEAARKAEQARKKREYRGGKKQEEHREAIKSRLLPIEEEEEMPLKQWN